MSLTESRIRLMARYLSDDQMIQLYGITNMDIREAFLDMDRPTPDPQALVVDLEAMERYKNNL